MISKSFILAIVSVFIFLFVLGLLSYVLSPNEYEGGEFLQLLFFGGGTLIPIVFAILLLLNLVVQCRIKFLKKNNPNTIYFFYSIILSVLPVLAFVLFDYLDRGRFFDEKTFLSIMGEYSTYFILAAFIILVNRKIVWNNFRKYKNGSAIG